MKVSDGLQKRFFSNERGVFMQVEASTLNPDVVAGLFQSCLWNDEDDVADRVEVEGIVHHVAFHRGRLEECRDDVVALLAELPEAFRESSPEEGASFLAACHDRHGNCWTGHHAQIERLFQLGMGIGKAKFLLPREVWVQLPGGMPYLSISV